MAAINKNFQTPQSIPHLATPIPVENESKVTSVAIRTISTHKSTSMEALRRVISIISKFLAQIADRIKSIAFKIVGISPKSKIEELIPMKEIVNEIKPKTGVQRHIELRNLALALGYVNNIEGLCNGIAFVGMQAALIGESSSFNARLDRLTLLLNKHNGDVNAAAKDIHENPILSNDILPFFEAIELWNNPELHVDLFTPKTKPTFQNDPKSIKPLSVLAGSQKLAAIGGMSQLATFSGVYDENDLLSYLKQLRQMFETSTGPVGVNIGSGDHSISIVYDPKKKSWLFVDSNDLPIQEENDDDYLLTYIQQAFLSETCVMSSSIFALNKDVKSFKKQLNAGLNSEEFKKLHEISPEKIEFLDPTNGDSWVYVASMTGDEKAVQALLAAGAHPNIINFDGDNAIYMAAQNGYAKIVEMLLANKADPNISNRTGETPLYIAAQNGHLQVVKALLAAGADLDITNSKGRAALDIAHQQGHKQIVKILEKQIGSR